MRLLDLLTLEEETTRLSCNIENQTPSGATSYSRRTDISVNAIVLEEAVEVTVC
jgi:hypothetical protein